ncbi:MAG: enoyl-CoA hydratase/isomerase family protein [Clostridiales bacterium]|jgi:enoyl-CoA hydratase|nr:enoyl-CoA hydratase/isomerase family protein [Clostridiales bacterium]
MEYGKVISYEKQGTIGVIDLINEAKANVFGEEFFNELEAIEAEISKDYELRVVLIISEGKIFSAGIDLFSLKDAGSETIKKMLVRFQRLFNFFQEIPIPVVCGIQGKCFGSGVELALACDIRVCDEDGKLSLPEGRFGLAPDVGGTTRLTKLVGPGWAKFMLMTGMPIKGKDALNIGLCQMAVPGDMVQMAAMQIATEISNLPPMSMRFVKRGVNVASEASTQAGMYFEEAQSIYCCGTEDLKEGISAFQEKRDANFVGK